MKPQDAIDSLFLTTLSGVLVKFGLKIEDVDIDLKLRTVDCTEAIKNAGLSGEEEVAMVIALVDAVG